MIDEFVNGASNIAAIIAGANIGSYLTSRYTPLIHSFGSKDLSDKKVLLNAISLVKERNNSRNDFIYNLFSREGRNVAIYFLEKKYEKLSEGETK